MSPRQEDIDLIENSALFDAAHYLREFPDVAMSDLSPATHYLEIGGTLGRAPSDEFDAATYLATYLDVAARGDNPLLHFERHGRNEGRSPKPNPPQALDETDPTVDVVIPVFNALEDVQNCLNALATAPNTHRFRALVINDGSDAATTKWLREACQTLGADNAAFELIEHPQNLGYTKTVNTGLRAANAAFVVTLNSDTIVTAHWLDGLVACMQSDPKLGIVGPLSNAASWQNVPTLFAQDQSFAINPLPEGVTAQDMAATVRAASQQTYPRSSFLNGFCFMIRRAVINAIGYMDEAAFPVGYGEENDFCIRAQDAGFALAIADDVYVFHAKSKSFGTAQRVNLSEQGTERLRQKHGGDKFDALLARAAQTERMDKVRRNIRLALMQTTNAASERTKELITNQRILFILPVRGGGGGAHSVVQEVAAMRDMGVDAKIAVHDGDLHDFLQLYSDIDNAKGLFIPFTPQSLLFIAGGYDIVVATIYSSVKMLEQITAKQPWIMPAYYAQDYEPLFFEEDSTHWQEASESYGRIPGMFIFAKTDWICETIERHHAVHVHKVSPSLDHRVFGLSGARLGDNDGSVSVCAMIRPSTPRRGAGRTLELLSRIKAQHGSDVTIRVFGCEDSDPDFQALKPDFEHVNHGVLSRPQVAELLRSSDVFIDLSDYQAFGRTGLEAMACGALAVVPQAGGASEYAIDAENALIVDSMDIDTCFERISPLLGDRARLEEIQLMGIETASGYSPRRAAMSELRAFAAALCAWRLDHPRPADQTRLLLLPDVQNPGDPALPGLGNERLPGPYQRGEFLNRWNVMTLTSAAPGPCRRGDIAVLQGNARDRFGDGFEAWIAQWKQEGGRIIYDLNGDVEDPAPLDPDLADGADVITASDPMQRDQVFYDHPSAAFKVIEVPSYLDDLPWRATAPLAAENDRLQIGYFGAKSNQPDLERITPTLAAVQEQHDVDIRILGPYQDTQPPIGERVNYPKRLSEPTFQQSEFIRWLTKATRWDIIVLPDQGPLRLKFWQMCALQGAVICRDAPDLYGIARHEENCLLVDDQPAEWQAALERLIKDQKLRRALAKQSRTDLVENWTQKANGALYTTVLEKAIHGF